MGIALLELGDVVDLLERDVSDGFVARPRGTLVNAGAALEKPGRRRRLEQQVIGAVVVSKPKVRRRD